MMTNQRLLRLVMILLVLYGCGPGNNSSGIRGKYTPSQVFTADSEACSKICWMEIEPGITTKDLALEQLGKSELVVQSSLERTADEIKLTWFTDNSKSITGYAELKLAEGVIQSIALRQLTPFTVSDFIEVLGSPEEIGISAWQGVHGEKFTSYTLYYVALNSMLQVATGSDRGPNPEDFVDWAGINFVLDEGTSRQPWLGYDHLNDYLLWESTPTK